ncbi:aromatic ring-hydroxylating dioxygenase subunit alpha [Planosporangium mesophilum]|uniref:Vanillate monooxygenase n=1 Tax=Planosporangium mesophilum TaxID=689768 RepID=A0A8J3X2R6_9ACTN|nr:aromatic ring-hydroxylating dioxygenase subunit alpha [Planosporangium mesophilum]NJC86179.1 aromatic ring-hydroxylating dioxygenase subunit alpha [Planosporangium mesophilum]GII25730.1 vanillate monooxygenase [Planosporangium mesophilum]
MTTAFARNQWYVAAYSQEVGEDLMARTICGEPIVFYRTGDGQAVGLADRCVHRRYPLSLSHRDGDRIVCGYHGFTYEPTGACVYVPGQTRVPRTARVPSYPIVEQDSLVWIWIGDAAKADATRIPRVPYLAAEGWTTVRGMEPLAARYSLLVDNLLDLSHETYLHGGYIGTPEVAETPITTEVDEEAGIVRVSRRMKDAECPPFYAKSTGITGRIDRWQDIEYYPPCLYTLHSRIAPTGVEPGPDGDDSRAAHAEIVYAITPETESSTHDFWMVARDFAVDDEEVSRFLAESNRTVVLQDVVALNALEKVIATEPDGYQELSINIDTGGLAARRILKRLAEAS